MLNDLFGDKNGEKVLKGLRTCSYEEFATLARAADEYMQIFYVGKLWLGNKEISVLSMVKKV